MEAVHAAQVLQRKHGKVLEARLRNNGKVRVVLRGVIGCNVMDDASVKRVVLVHDSAVAVFPAHATCNFQNFQISALQKALGALTNAALPRALVVRHALDELNPLTSGRKLFAVQRSGILKRVDEGDMGRSEERAACNMLLERLISHADVATSTAADAAAAARCTTRSMHEDKSIGEDCRLRGV